VPERSKIVEEAEEASHWSPHRWRHHLDEKAMNSPNTPPRDGGWSQRLFLQIINEGELYPALLWVYRQLAGRVLDHGETADVLWTHFIATVERYWPECRRRYETWIGRKLELEHGFETPPCRHAAWLIAERFCEECRLNPQDFREVA